jgi:hypothetical protein
MSTHLQKFVDRVRGAEARGAKDFIMSMNDARDLHADITRLLIDLNNLRDAVIAKNNEDPVVTVEINGGTFQ